MGACARSVRVRPSYFFWQRVRRSSRRGTEVTERRQQLRDERRLELFFRVGAALTIPLGAGTGLRLEDTRHRLALCRRAFLERKLAAPAREPLDNT